MRKDKFINFRPMKFIGGLFFLMAFIINVQISENGDWELVNVGYALEEDGGTPGITCPAWGQVGGSCHITIQRYKQTAYGTALCDYCEWTGYQNDFCEPLSHGGCMTV